MMLTTSAKHVHIIEGGMVMCQAERDISRRAKKVQVDRRSYRE
ncbi:hypothetical protein CFT9_15157 [Pseudomonas sp. CFT9]|jgi:hypothetical protein|uniref:Uncharacterized protein n=1 Tax=Pseudomonas gorinensis TaxID=3240790 RepID=A0ACA7P0Y4_9PSED|nr:hypothetical protein U771_04915 [Pseudomonas sp. TKP]EPJ82886.1 hypothetical protein CFT9_15157 [Pseudomonas sp. CFT9]|tara:strand:- start:357 stop:485 length:129 start_codon:yes stop_codon:yes gene_type:complete